MAEPYDTLVPWCQANPGTEQEQWDALNAETVTVLKRTPVSLRTFMLELTPTEYITAKTIMETAAQSNVLVKDALAIMADVGVLQDAGIDIASANARFMMDSLFTGDYAALGAKIKSLGEYTMSQIDVWRESGVVVERGHLVSAREMV